MCVWWVLYGQSGTYATRLATKEPAPCMEKTAATIRPLFDVCADSAATVSNEEERHWQRYAQAIYTHTHSASTYARRGTSDGGRERIFSSNSDSQQEPECRESDRE